MAVILGVECTAHTLGMGVVEGGTHMPAKKSGHGGPLPESSGNREVLSNAMDTYKPGKAEGILPRKAADHHAEVFGRVLDEALSKAGKRMDGISLIAFSQGPGIGAPLAVGIAGAKYLAARHGKPLIGVNHCHAHIKISEHLTGLENALVLYLSGGNSQILVAENGDSYRVLGETLDMGIGNMFDSFGRELGMEYAHGSALEKLASAGKYLPLPYSVKGMNLVFSGLQTQAEKLVKAGAKKEDVAHSLMETAFAMACEATERALFMTRKKKLVLCGGVAQNRRLQGMLKTMCAEDGVKFGVAPDEFNRDNGAMIAYAGGLLFRKYGAMPVEKCVPITNYRIERMREVLGGGK